MAKIELTLRLAKKAKSKGGDRYEGDLSAWKIDKPLALYFPQEWTRNGDQVLEEIVMTLDTPKAANQL